MNINVNFSPLYISIDTKKNHLSFGFYYNLKLYSDNTGEKSVMKTRKAGYKWFFANCSKTPKKVETYAEMIKRWNGEKMINNESIL